jgi:hypothetical protein
MLHRLATVLLAIVVLASVPPALDAQDVVVGAKGGLSFANISTDEPDLASSDSRNGFLAGLFLEIGLGEIFALQPEVLYAQKGFADQEEGVEVTAEFDYIDIPLLLKARFGADGRVRPGLYAGPVISFESSCSLTGEDVGVSVDVDCDIDEIEGLADRKTTDFAIAFGGEIQFDVSDNVVGLVDARYALGLTDIASDITDAESVKTRMFAIMAGLGIKVN